jgi:hypothetical protein
MNLSGPTDSFELSVIYSNSRLSQGEEQASDPRESMRRLPAFLQPLLTLLTGKPLPEEKSWQLTPWHHLGSACLSLAVGAIGSIILVSYGWRGILGLLLTWLLTAHGARKNRTVIMHQCSHHNFVRVKWFDRLLGKVISLVLISEEFDAYQNSHLRFHHSTRHQTVDDPTVAFLFYELGLSPGMAPRRMWMRLFTTIISPAYHTRFFSTRLKSHFLNTSFRYQLIFTLFWSGMITALSTFGLWWEFIFAWLVPVVLLYQVSTAFRLASKHIFPRRLPAKRTRASLGEFTIGIFTGAECPPPNLSLMKNLTAWSWWWMRMLLFHLPTQLFILPGDGCAHDFHHRYPSFPDWSNYIHNRAKDLASAEAMGVPYREVWGIHRAIQECFETLSLAEPNDYYVTTASMKTINSVAADE